MEKQQAREQNKNAVMFCHEGSFFTFYDVDALIVNRTGGYKIIASGERPKAGVPLSNTSLFARFEQEDIPFFVFKKGEGIIRKHEAPDDKYLELCQQIAEQLGNEDKTVDKYFNSDRKEPAATATKTTTKSKLETLADGQDPFTGQALDGLSDQARTWLRDLGKAIGKTAKLVQSEVKDGE